MAPPEGKHLPVVVSWVPGILEVKQELLLTEDAFVDSVSHLSF